MFGYSLTHDQERSALKLLGLVATADRKVTDNERQYVVDISHDFNASAEGVLDPDDQESLHSICKEFDDETAKRIALVYAARLSMVDGLHKEEAWPGLRQLGEAMDVQEEDVNAIQDWVRRGIEWEKEGRDLLQVPETGEA
jgi:hypothetical protein